MFHKRIFAVMALLAFCPAILKAQLRSYLDTYNYRVINESHKEIQIQTNFHNPPEGKNYYSNQTGFEYGASDLYTIGIYGVFVEDEGLTAGRILNRYRITGLEFQERPLDMSVQFEFHDANDHKAQDKFEGVMIVSRDFNQVNITGNGILQLNRDIKSNGEDEWDIDPVISIAASMKTDEELVPGIELILGQDESRIVPGAYMMLIPGVRLNIGAAIGLDRHVDDFQLKTILSAEF